MRPSGRPHGSSWSWWSGDLTLSIATKGSVLSIGSVGSFGSAISSFSFASLGSAFSGLSRWSLFSWLGDHEAPDSRPTLRVVPDDEPDLRVAPMSHCQT